MTATQMKRMRAKLAQAQKLTAEAHELTRVGHAHHGLQELTARAADDVDAAVRNLASWDAQMRANAEAIAREVTR